MNVDVKLENRVLQAGQIFVADFCGSKTCKRTGGASRARNSRGNVWDSVRQNRGRGRRGRIVRSRSRIVNIPCRHKGPVTDQPVTRECQFAIRSCEFCLSYRKKNTPD